MRRILWLTILCFLTISCTKTVEVGRDEIGLVFSNWNGKISDTFYNPGSYKISYFKGFTDAKIIEETDSIRIEWVKNRTTKILNIELKVKPLPKKNFELLEKYGLDYKKRKLKPILDSLSIELKEFQGTDKDLIQRLRKELEDNIFIEKYLTITSIEMIHN